uniref:Uncharacterized protein n=1 Tax=Tanacetum cinerariifolium TaxID=118510 RepID=A0A699KKQ5_TANCI|nr:hypothetical protein [Tanacetum cinerariifolium]
MMTRMILRKVGMMMRKVEVMKRMMIKKQGTKRALNLSLEPLKVVGMKATVKRIKTKGREESEGDKTDESDDGSDDGNDDDNDETVKAGFERDEDDDDNDDEEELAKNDDEDTESGKVGDEVSKSKGESNEEETRQEEEESFNPIPRTPEGSEDEGNDEED